jgi:hypothetical protein
MAVTLITPTAYARHRGCDEKAVRKAIAANRISTINGLVDAGVADIQWAQNTRARADSTKPAGATVPPTTEPPTTMLAPSTADEGEYSVNRARRERYEADLAQMKLQEQQGDLVRVVEVRAEIAKRVGQVRMNLLQIPARLAPLLANEADQAKVHAILEAELRAVLAHVTAAA